MTFNATNISLAQRQVLIDLVKGAVLIARFGAFETYREEDGRIRPCGNSLTSASVQHLLIAAPEVAPMRPELEGTVYRLPAEHRARYSDELQQSMAIQDLVEEAQHDRPRMRCSV